MNIPATILLAPNRVWRKYQVVKRWMNWRAVPDQKTVILQKTGLPVPRLP